jgi:hypothetical protein
VPVKLPLNPKHPERICWGCDKYCPADDLACGNGTIRTQHPAELFGDDWLEWSNERSERKVRRTTADAVDALATGEPASIEACQS